MNSRADCRRSAINDAARGMQQFDVGVSATVRALPRTLASKVDVAARECRRLPNPDCRCPAPRACRNPDKRGMRQCCARGPAGRQGPRRAAARTPLIGTRPQKPAQDVSNAPSPNITLAPGLPTLRQLQTVCARQAPARHARTRCEATFLAGIIVQLKQG